MRKTRKSREIERKERDFLDNLLARIQDVPALTEYIAQCIPYLLSTSPSEVEIMIIMLDAEQKTIQIPATVPYVLSRQLRRRYYSILEDEDYPSLEKILREKTAISLKPKKSSGKYTLLYPFLGCTGKVVSIAKVLGTKQLDRQDMGKIQRVFYPPTGTTSRAGVALETSQIVYYDMTGVLTFRIFEKETKEAIEKTIKDNTSLGLGYVDLDNFGDINNLLGHFTGNKYLREAAQIISKDVGERNIIGRFGGDEFVFALADSDSSEAKSVSEEIREHIERKFREELKPHSLSLTASIGYAVCPPHKTDFVSLLEVADKAMLKAKREGKNRVVSAELP